MADSMPYVTPPSRDVAIADARAAYRRARDVAVALHRTPERQSAIEELFLRGDTLLAQAQLPGRLLRVARGELWELIAALDDFDGLDYDDLLEWLAMFPRQAARYSRYALD
jgi:hypothetical protein